MWHQSRQWVLPSLQQLHMFVQLPKFSRQLSLWFNILKTKQHCSQESKLLHIECKHTSLSPLSKQMQHKNDDRNVPEDTTLGVTPSAQLQDFASHLLASALLQLVNVL